MTDAQRERDLIVEIVSEELPEVYGDFYKAVTPAEMYDLFQLHFPDFVLSPRDPIVGTADRFRRHLDEEKEGPELGNAEADTEIEGSAS